MDLTQFHLKGKGFSGRAVRLRPLGPTAKHKAIADASKATQAEGGGDQVFASWRNTFFILAALAEVTPPCATADDVFKAKWTKPDVLALRALDEPGGLHSLFTTKDIDVLSKHLGDTYLATVGEADEILGGMTTVASE